MLVFNSTNISRRLLARPVHEGSSHSVKQSNILCAILTQHIDTARSVSFFISQYLRKLSYPYYQFNKSSYDQDSIDL